MGEIAPSDERVHLASTTKEGREDRITISVQADLQRTSANLWMKARGTGRSQDIGLSQTYPIRIPFPVHFIQESGFLPNTFNPAKFHTFKSQSPFCKDLQDRHRTLSPTRFWKSIY